MFVFHSTPRLSEGWPRIQRAPHSILKTLKLNPLPQPPPRGRGLSQERGFCVGGSFSFLVHLQREPSSTNLTLNVAPSLIMIDRFVEKLLEFDWSIPKVRLRADVDDSTVMSDVNHVGGIQGLWKN